MRQSIGSTAQSALQGRERPRRRPILLAVRYPAELPHDTLPVGRGIGGAPSSTGLVIEGRQAQPVETADERGYGVPHPPPDGGSRGSQGAARGDRQQGLGALVTSQWLAGGAQNLVKGLLLRRGQRP